MKKNSRINMCKITVTMPYSEIDAIHEEARLHGVSFDAYVRYCCRMGKRFRLVPLIGTCR